MPLVKHCSVSIFDIGTGAWLFDGINNHGFSGGPVISGFILAYDIKYALAAIYQNPLGPLRAPD
jgi:hypothetical protein